MNINKRRRHQKSERSMCRRPDPGIEKTSGLNDRNAIRR
jgi:hypothetical protein